MCAVFCLPAGEALTAVVSVRSFSIFGAVGVSCAVLFAWFGCHSYESGAYGYQLFVPRARAMWTARLLCATLVLRAGVVVAMLFTDTSVCVGVCAWAGGRVGVVGGGLTGDHDTRMHAHHRYSLSRTTITVTAAVLNLVYYVFAEVRAAVCAVCVCVCR